MTLESEILKSAQTKRPAWFVREAAPGVRMDMKKPGIKWSEIKSLSIDGLTVRVTYSDRKQVTTISTARPRCSSSSIIDRKTCRIRNMFFPRGQPHESTGGPRSEIARGHP